MFSLTSFIARKLISKNDDSHFFSWISTLSIVGVGLGVASMILVVSIFTGFEQELRKKFLAANAHVMVFRFPGGLENYSKWEDHLTAEFGRDFEALSPFVNYETMVRHDSLLQSVLVRGFIPSVREKVQSAKDIIRPQEALQIVQADQDSAGQNPLPPIIIGSGLAQALNVKIGEKIDLIKPENGSINSSQKFKVVGLYDSGLHHYDKKLVIMSLKTSQEIFSMGQRVTGLEIGLHDPTKSIEVAQKLSKSINLSVREWQSLNQSFFEAIHTQKHVIALIVFMIAFVASFNIFTTLFLNVTQKRKSIATLKVLGLKTSQVLKVFVQQGLFLGIVGSFVGIVTAMLLSVVLEQFEIIKLPDLYLLAKLPIIYDPTIYALMSSLGVLLCCLSSLIPAFLASRTKPMMSLKE